MLSANTTYLVFLIQLDVASKNKAISAVGNVGVSSNGSVLCHQ